jgi:hypothetical protein
VNDDVPLRKYIDRIMAERDLRYQQRFESQEKALEEAKRASEKRLDGMNEFRGSLTDAQKTYITRVEAMSVITRNEADIKAVTDRVNMQQGHSTGLKDGWGWIIGVLGLAMAAVSLYWRR